MLLLLTFNQQLWWKVLTVVRNQRTDSKMNHTVLRLAGLHTEMSFLGSIGHFMMGLGLPGLLKLRQYMLETLLVILSYAE